MNKLLGLIIGALLVSVVSILFVDTKWEIVTDGECYTLKKGLYISGDCSSTKELAEVRLKRHLKYLAKVDRHENREWVKAN